MGKPYNLFTKEEIDKIAGSDVSQGNVQEQVAPTADVSSQSQPVQSAAQFDVTRDQYGNVYTNGKNTPAKVSNPSAVPVVEPQRRPIRSTEELAEAMSYTSPEEEERLRKASVTNQRIMAVADALRHIGNIANTVDYSPSQQFNQPWAEERARYERGKALRDAANYKYMSYEQAKAAQEQRARQLDAELAYKREKDAAAAQATKDYRDALLKDRADRWREQLSYKKEEDERKREQRQSQYDKQNEFTQQRINISASKSGGGGRKSSGGGRRRTGGSAKQNKKVTVINEPDVRDRLGNVVRKGRRTTYTEYGNYHPKKTSNRSGFFNN